MARHKKSISTGEELCEHLSIGVLAMSYPRRMIDEVLQKTGRQSVRVRDFPAAATVYFLIAMGLFMTQPYGEILRCLVEGLKWLGAKQLNEATKGAISSARKRLGSEPLRLLHESAVAPLGSAQTPGCFYRGWRLVAFDGSTFALQDTAENEVAFGRPSGGRGNAAWPMLRFVVLCELGTHTMLKANPGRYNTSEAELVAPLLDKLDKDMLCLADRGFFSYEAWNSALQTGAHLLWRAKANMLLESEKDLPDGSWLSTIYPGTKERRRKEKGVCVRVIAYELLDENGAVIGDYRLISSQLEAQMAPADELAALYAQRWEIEGSLKEIKTHLREGRQVLRSKTPDLVFQEFWGLLLAHHAVRSVVVQAAQNQGRDPDEMSFTHAVRVLRRKAQKCAPFPPEPEASLGEGIDP